MSSLTFSKEYDLGQWNQQLSKKTALPKQLHLTLEETVELTFRKINPRTGMVGKLIQCKGNAEEVYDSLLHAKRYRRFSILFRPERTHNFKELLLDVLIPTTRRLSFASFYSESDKDRIPYFMQTAYKVLAFTAQNVFCFLLDIGTLLCRTTTAPYTVWKNRQSPDHEAKKFFPREEAVSVECKKAWRLIPKNTPKITPISVTTQFKWRVDFFPPLQSKALHKGKWYPFDSKPHKMRKIEEESEGFVQRRNFNVENLRMNLQQVNPVSQETITLTQKLTGICALPIVKTT